jgi:hypothetical protein
MKLLDLFTRIGEDKRLLPLGRLLLLIVRRLRLRYYANSGKDLSPHLRVPRLTVDPLQP